MRTLIKNGHLIDPANNKNGKFDLLINKGKIVEDQLISNFQKDNINLEEHFRNLTI